MIMDNSSDIFKIDTVRQPQIMSNAMMRNFVTRTSAAKSTRRKAEIIQQRPKKKAKTSTINIASFFKK